MIRYLVLTVLYYLCDSIHLLISIHGSLFPNKFLPRNISLSSLLLSSLCGRIVGACTLQLACFLCSPLNCHVQHTEHGPLRSAEKLVLLLCQGFIVELLLLQFSLLHAFVRSPTEKHPAGKVFFLFVFMHVCFLINCLRFARSPTKKHSSGKVFFVCCYACLLSY